MASGTSQDLRSGFATVTTGTIFLLVATILLVGFNFVARVVIVRSVSLAEWNAFSLGFTLTQVLLAVGGLGLPLAVARSLPYARGDAERRTILRTALTLGSGAAVVTGVVLLVVGGEVGRSLGSSQVGFGLEFFAVAVISLIIGTLLAAVFQGFSNVTPNALFLQIVSPGLFVVFLAAAFLLPPGRLTFADALVAYAAAAVVTMTAVIAYSLARLPRELLHGPGDRSSRSALLTLAVPLFITGVMSSVAGYGDTLVLGAFHYAQVGTYTASLTFARLVQVGVSAASYIFLPVASGFLARGDRRAVRLTYVTVTKWLTVFSLPLFMVFVFLPSSSLYLVYGPNYSTVILPLQIVVTGAFVGTLLGPSWTALIAAGRARLAAINSVVAGAADVVLSVALVPQHGAAGAAVAWSIANVLYAGLCLAQVAAADDYHPFGRDFLLPLGIVGVPVAAALGVFRPHLAPLALPVVVVAFALAFALVATATGRADEGDRLLLEAVERLLGRPLPFVRRWALALRGGRR